MGSPLFDSAFPQGTLALGRVMRIEKATQPFAYYIVTIQMHTLEFNNWKTDFSATMDEAGPAAGLMHESKRLAPTFTKRRSARLQILVGEQQRGMGVIHWDAGVPFTPSCMQQASRRKCVRRRSCYPRITTACLRFAGVRNGRLSLLTRAGARTWQIEALLYLVFIRDRWQGRTAVESPPARLLHAGGLRP